MSTPSGRNDPCPCGSGLKFKKCHGTAQPLALQTPAAPGVAETAAAQQIDHELVERMLRFSKARHGKRWFDAAIAAYTAAGPGLGDEELQLALPWAFHAFPWGAEDESLAETFRREQGRRLPPEMRALLDAQLEAWCSLWAVERVERGVGIAIRDLLSHEERFVHERLGSQEIHPGLTILARVVDSGGISFLAGLHPQPSPSTRAYDLVTDARRRCHVRTRPVSRDALRDPAMQLWLIQQWRSLASELRRPPVLSNTDGDPLQLTTDHLVFAPAGRDEVLSRLARLEGAEEAEAVEDDTVIVITRAGNARIRAFENTILGRLVIGSERIRLETNSTRRADALRAAVLAITSPLVSHRLREEANTEYLLHEAREAAERGDPPPPGPNDSPEALAVVRAFKERHYAAWLDDKLPALGGLTPRVAATRSPATRMKLEMLLQDLERSEARRPAAERYEMAVLRAALGMQEPMRVP